VIATFEKTDVEHIEVASDEFSHFRFTSVTVRIPHDRPETGSREVLDAYRNPLFQVLRGIVRRTLGAAEGMTPARADKRALLLPQFTRIGFFVS
jgi:hypothetical protein